jgi:hypothetical protein
MIRVLKGGLGLLSVGGLLAMSVPASTAALASGCDLTVGGSCVVPDPTGMIPNPSQTAAGAQQCAATPVPVDCWTQFDDFVVNGQFEVSLPGVPVESGVDTTSIDQTYYNAAGALIGSEETNGVDTGVSGAGTATMTGTSENQVVDTKADQLAQSNAPAAAPAASAATSSSGDGDGQSYPCYVTNSNAGVTPQHTFTAEGQSSHTYTKYIFYPYVKDYARQINGQNTWQAEICTSGTSSVQDDGRGWQLTLTGASFSEKNGGSTDLKAGAGITQSSGPKYTSTLGFQLSSTYAAVSGSVTRENQGQQQFAYGTGPVSNAADQYPTSEVSVYWDGGSSPSWYTMGAVGNGLYEWYRNTGTKFIVVGAYNKMVCADCWRWDN